MKVAVLCEFSGIVREAFRKAGHDATSFDLLDTEIPGPHVQGDILDVTNYCWSQFDLLICHPPCTHLAVSGARVVQGQGAGAKRGIGFCQVPNGAAL